MIERKVYGPMSFQAPIKRIRAILQLSGIRCTGAASTTHVFLDEVKGDNIDELKADYNYAGIIAADGSDTARLDITGALGRAVEHTPNFQITFLTEYDGAQEGGRVFDFEQLDILHDVPINTPLEVSADVMCGLVPGT